MDRTATLSNNEQTTATLQWLQSHFYGRKGVSISRCSMYSLYLAFCQLNNYRPVCKATFGKLIRIQFPFVTSKRLGARGQSKYHYYGIALKDNSRRSDSADCDFDKPLTRFSKNAKSLNQSDYHSIIHSMLDGSLHPESAILQDNKAIFNNIYKIHCQCLMDAALANNYSQMRHYVIHFWQQLPDHVQVDLQLMKQLDKNFYTTLENIYLKLSSTPEQIKHLHAIATLNPLWLEKALDGCDEKVRKIKFKEAFNWKSKVKTQFQLLLLIQSIDRSQIFAAIQVLRKLDYDELIIFNDLVLQSFIHLINNIDSKISSIESIINSIDDMIRWWGKIFYKELAVGFCQLQSYILKKLTQIQCPHFMSCHIFLTFLIDYLLIACG